jgi:alkanesulfonate monooxygenase SsuD/methylene tetrahydromethanopterin reductase-like flavin-dependent oxidoreductase (luciferase family)
MPSWSEVHAFTGRAEALGLQSVWVCDHFVSSPPGRPVEGIHEGWTILSALAASTTRVELGQLVMCASFRNPALLAKMAATADAISGGRLILGLGAGWYDPEYEAFGYPTDHRVGRFEEALQIIGPLLHGESVAFAGRFHQVRNAMLLPPPDRPIPILVAAKGPRMLRLTARYADAWNTAWFGHPDDRLRQRLADLEAALDAEDRDPATLRRTVGMHVVDPDVTTWDNGDDVACAGSIDELARAIDAYEVLGFDDGIVVLQPMTERSLDPPARPSSFEAADSDLAPAEACGFGTSATHTAPRPIPGSDADQRGATRIGCPTTRFVRGSIVRTNPTRPSPRSRTHTRSAPSVASQMPRTRTLAINRPVRASRRLTDCSDWLSTQTAPLPTASPTDASPTGIPRPTRLPIGVTVFEQRSETQRRCDPTARLKSHMDVISGGPIVFVRVSRRRTCRGVLGVTRRPATATTQTPARPAASPQSPPGTRIRAETRFVAGSTRKTALRSKSPTQTAPAPAATSVGVQCRFVWTSTARFVRGSIRQRVWYRPGATHTEPNPTASECTKPYPP